VLQGGVGSEDGVVGLNYSCGNLGSWVNGELQLGLLAIIDRETFHQQGGEPGTSSPSKAVENQEALKTCALVSLLEKRNRENILLLLFAIYFHFSYNSKNIDLTKHLVKNSFTNIYKMTPNS